MTSEYHLDAAITAVLKCENSSDELRSGSRIESLKSPSTIAASRGYISAMLPTMHWCLKRHFRRLCWFEGLEYACHISRSVLCT